MISATILALTSKDYIRSPCRCILSITPRYTRRDWIVIPRASEYTNRVKFEPARTPFRLILLLGKESISPPEFYVGLGTKNYLLPCISSQCLDLGNLRHRSVAMSLSEFVF